MSPLCRVVPMWQPCRVTPGRLLARTLGAGVALGAGVTAYAAWEARAYTLRSVDLPVLPDGARAAAGAAPQRPPPDARPVAQARVAALAGRPRARPRREHRRQPRPPRRVARRCWRLSGRCSTSRACSCSGPTTTSRRSCATRWATCCPDDGKRYVHSAKLPWRELCDAFAAAGWTDLTNRRTSTTVRDLTIAWAGVDDPHLAYDDLAAVAGPAPTRRRPAHRGGPRAVPAGARPVRGRRVRRGLRRAHPRRPDLPAAGRRAGHQLRPRAGPRQGPAPPSGRLPARRPGVDLAARLGGPRHLAVLPDPDRLPPRGDPADPDSR